MRSDVKIENARAFCEAFHHGQKRKYTEEPYHVHPVAVALIVTEAYSDPDVICAALLHDIVEDTPVTLMQIEILFGAKVAQYVEEVTDPCRPVRYNRAARKAMDRERLAQASAEGQTIKLADLIDNTRSIVKHDPSFAKVYLAEKRLLLEVLTKGNLKLRNQAGILLSDSCFQLSKLERKTHDLQQYL